MSPKVVLRQLILFPPGRQKCGLCSSDRSQQSPAISLRTQPPDHGPQLLRETLGVGAEEVVPVLGDHRALISAERGERLVIRDRAPAHREVQVPPAHREARSEEHTSELQSPYDL